MSIYYTLINLFANPNTNKPVRLHKQATKEDIRRELNYFIARNFNFIALASIIGLIIFLVSFTFFIAGLSMVESGAYYNHLQGVI